MTPSTITTNGDIRGSEQPMRRFNLLDGVRLDSLAHSRMIGHLLGFRSREGRFVILESLLDYLTNTKKLPGLEGFCIDKAPCRLELGSHKAGCNDHWVFGSDEQWKADQCCEILALHKTNWTAGKRLPEADTKIWAVNHRIDRLLVLCLPPEDFVAPLEQTWGGERKEEPWKTDGDTADAQPFSPRLHRLIPCPGQDGAEWKVLKAAGGLGLGDGSAEPETDRHSHLHVVRKQVVTPKVTERYIRLSCLGDVLPWLREKALPVAETEDAGLCQAIRQYMGLLELCPAVLTDDGRAAAREAEIARKIELETAFRNRLVAALDRAGYRVKNGALPDEWAIGAIREKHENAPERASTPWDLLYIHSKDAAAICLDLWLSSDVPVLKFDWRPLGIEGVSVAGPSKRTEWNGAAQIDSAPAFCFHAWVVDERLGFGTLPLPVMREILRGGYFAEALAFKIVSVFERIRADHEACPTRRGAEGQAKEVRRSTL